MTNPFSDFLGYHVEFSEIAKHLGIHSRTFQVFLSEPSRMSIPEPKKVDQANVWQKAGARIIVHAPYTVNMNREGTDTNRATWDYTRDYIVRYHTNLIRVFKGPVPTLVIHTGKPDKTVSPEITKILFHRFLNKLIDGNTLLAKTFNIAIETDAAKGNSATHLDAIFDVVKSISHPGIGITFDTEHSYAAGRDPRLPLPDGCWDYIKVLHLNSIPMEVTLGSGLDRHADTSLRDSKDGEFILPLFREARKRNIPVILERRHDLALDDIQYLKDNA